MKICNGLQSRIPFHKINSSVCKPGDNITMYIRYAQSSYSCFFSQLRFVAIIPSQCCYGTSSPLLLCPSHLIVFTTPLNINTRFKKLSQLIKLGGLIGGATVVCAFVIGNNWRLKNEIVELSKNIGIIIIPKMEKIKKKTDTNDCEITSHNN
ncbi:hypothetical protein Glove_327g46 [Diversispora epigaea]|uniref:Uncharacterized protein n=1 Tax=Diversispora epigaea TaxID=1348612 RepID=A0A397HQH2_9GLOM|nr:hypothetical protein Glove_327g46 [Diversispora epigaea]